MKVWEMMIQLNFDSYLSLNIHFYFEIPFQIWIFKSFFGLPNFGNFVEFWGFFEIWSIYLLNIIFDNFLCYNTHINISYIIFYIYLMQFELIIEFSIPIVPQPYIYGVKSKVPFFGIIWSWNFKGVKGVKK